MRWLTLALIALQQKDANRKLEVRNGGLDAEVRDLKQGYEAIEERARFELGMIKQDEVFVQIPERRAPLMTARSSPRRLRQRLPPGSSPASEDWRRRAERQLRLPFFHISTPAASRVPESA